MINDVNLDKLKRMREKGINPYPYRFDVDVYSADIKEKYGKLKPEEKTQDSVSVAGRIMQLRRMGKVTFVHLQDDKGKIQLYFAQDILEKENYKLLKLYDIGDIIGVKGTIFKTRTGEVTVEVKEHTVLCKSLSPLPEKFHGLKDKEIRYRKRYLDFIMNPEVKETFIKRSRILNEIRSYMNENGFIEFDNAVLETQYGGAAARPFTTNINAFNMNMFLRISLELPLKKEMVGGFSRVYCMSKVFRNEGVDKDHNPEFTLLEWYEAYADYNTKMDRCEELFKRCAKLMGKDKFSFLGHDVDLSKPFERISMKDALKKYADIDVDASSDDELKKIIDEKGFEMKLNPCRGVYIQTLFEELVEEKLIQPTFIIDHPVEVSPLTKMKRDGEEGITERAELFIAGSEMANMYSELSDPIDQRERLVQQSKESNTDEAYAMDEDFCESLEYGMPPAGGIGIGVDRFIMLLTESESIRDVLVSPIMKLEQKDEK